MTKTAGLADTMLYNARIDKRETYEARAFIRKCLKTGEPFPVRKVQLKFPKELKK